MTIVAHYPHYSWESKILTWDNIHYLVGQRAARWKGDVAGPTGSEAPTASELGTYLSNTGVSSMMPDAHASNRCVTFGAMRNERTVGGTATAASWSVPVAYAAISNTSSFNATTGAKTYRVKLTWTKQDSLLATAIYRRANGGAWLHITTLVNSVAASEWEDTSVTHGVLYEYYLSPRDREDTWEGRPSTDYVTLSITLPEFTTNVAGTFQGETDPTKPTITGWAWVSFSAGAGTSSVRWRHNYGGSWSGWTTIDVNPGDPGYETTHITGTPGDAITFELQAYSGNNLSGTAGSVQTFSGQIGGAGT